MDARVRTLLDAQGGVTSALQTARAGVSRHQLRRWVKRKELLRFPRGIIVDPEIWEQAPVWDRHALRARGLMLGHFGEPESTAALSHHSALALLGVPLYDVDQRVHVVRTDGLRLRTDPILCAHAPVSPDAVQEVDGIRMVRPPIAVAQVAAAFGIESGLVSADGCLRQKLATREELHEALDLARLGNGRAVAERVVELADGRAESAGESRCRWVFGLLGLPTVTPQAEIRDAAGYVIARVDFLLEAERVALEFDGKTKYGKGADLFAEKQREDAIRRLGYTVVRITWDDLAHPNRIKLRVQEAIDLQRSKAVRPA